MADVSTKTVTENEGAPAEAPAMTPEQMKQMLESLNNEEKKTQEKMNGEFL